MDRSLNSGERQVSANPQEIDKWHRWRYEEAAKLILPKDFVVDYGCGIGYGSKILAQKAGKVIGLDDSPEALYFASQNYHQENINYVECFLEEDEFCFGENGADVSVAFEVLEHLANPFMFMKKVSKATKRTLVLSTPYVTVDLEKSDWHYKHYCEREIVELFTAAGFNIKKLSVMNFSKGQAIFCIGEKM